MLVDLLEETNYNAKITEIEGKTTSIIGLATTVVLNAVENKMPKFSDLVKKKQIMIQKHQTLRLNIYYYF